MYKTILVVSLLFPTLVFGQSLPMRYVGILNSFKNSPCNPALGDLAMATDAVAGQGLYLCTAPSTWTAVSGTGTFSNTIVSALGLVLGAGTDVSGAVTLTSKTSAAAVTIAIADNAASGGTLYVPPNMGGAAFTALINRTGAAVASATTTTLGTDGDVAHITGTTAITTLNTCNATSSGRRMTLIFDGILTFTDGNNLKLAGNFATAANSTISLVCDGTSWFETARSTN
jgi:hypothetical protein